jgi:hypothetical protein
MEGRQHIIHYTIISNNTCSIKPVSSFISFYYVYPNEKQISLHPKYDFKSQVDFCGNDWVVESHYLEIQGLLWIMKNTK